MNLQALINKKNEALKIIENQLLDLINLENNEIIPTVAYKNIDNKNYFIFSTYYKNGAYNSHLDTEYNLYNQYIISYNVESDEFSLEGKDYDAINCYFDDGVDILNIHQQLCNKKQDMLKIINQDF